MAKSAARILYTVRGRWPFPLDMLRFDDAVPATEEDRLLVEMLSADHCPDGIDTRAPHQVRLHLRRPVRSGLPYGSGVRWESFSWRVVRGPEREL